MSSVLSSLHSVTVDQISISCISLVDIVFPCNTHSLLLLHWIALKTSILGPIQRATIFVGFFAGLDWVYMSWASGAVYLAIFCNWSSLWQKFLTVIRTQKEVVKTLIPFFTLKTTSWKVLNPITPILSMVYYTLVAEKKMWPDFFWKSPEEMHVEKSKFRPTWVVVSSQSWIASIWAQIRTKLVVLGDSEYHVPETSLI